MRFLADENLPGPVVRALRSLGHDVALARDTIPGAEDREILLAAGRGGRVLLTCDKDFGELAFHSGLALPFGVVLFRLSGVDPSADNARMVTVIESRADWPGHFSIVTDTRVRLRPVPAPPGTG